MVATNFFRQNFFFWVWYLPLTSTFAFLLNKIVSNGPFLSFVVQTAASMVAEGERICGSVRLHGGMTSYLVRACVRLHGGMTSCFVLCMVLWEELPFVNRFGGGNPFISCSPSVSPYLCNYTSPKHRLDSKDPRQLTRNEAGTNRCPSLLEKAPTGVPAYWCWHLCVPAYWSWHSCVPEAMRAFYNWLMILTLFMLP